MAKATSNNLAVLAAEATVARQAALMLRSRRDRVNAYWRSGPVPPMPRDGDFIDRCKIVDTAIEAILDGAPVTLFDWTQPPTPESLEHNRTAPWRWSSAIKPKVQPRITERWTVDGASARGMAALRDESEILSTRREGERNKQLNESAFNLGQLVGSGELPEWVVVAELSAAAAKTGLDASEINRSLNSGLTAGKSQPRVR